MKNKTQLILVAVMMALLTAGFVFFNEYSKTHQVEGTDFERREVAKEFKLPVIGKSQFFPSETALSLTEARKKPVLVHFWASWCTICREEKPTLDAFWEKHKDEDIVVLGLASFDTKEAMDESKLIAKPTFTVLLDADGEIANAYKVSALPVSVLIGADGFIVQKFMGTLKPYDFVAIENYLDSLKKSH
jgi:thiol-disulfide isomerase/thioredoxin